MPPRVRKAPLMERIKSALNVMDFLLWLSEELETRDWDSKSVAVKLGVALNFVFMIARANAEDSTDAEDELFGDGGGSSWVPMITRPLTWLLVMFAFTNAIWAMTRVRNYRLFEVDIEQRPDTPSARRVRVQSTPTSSSPMRFLTSIMTTETAESRAHPDATRDVWEVSVWDPLPMSLALFCVFGPGHVLIHMMFLPVLSLDARPSITVLNCMVLQAIISCQLWLLQGRFSRQIKDAAVIQKEVMHEYDKKYVHPQLRPVVREAGTQVNITAKGELRRELVEVGTPTIYIRRGFQSQPNPNYAHHVDPDTPQPTTVPRRAYTSTASTAFQSGHTPLSDYRNPVLRQSMVGTTPPPPSRGMTGPGSATNFGGSLGVYTHAQSPLKNVANMEVTGMEVTGASPRMRTPKNGRDMARFEQDDNYEDQLRRQPSPVKEARRLTGNPFQRKDRYTGERYPSRFS